MQNDHRVSIRMNVEKTLSFRLTDSPLIFHGVCKNLSSSGMVIVSERAIEPGTIVAVTMESTLGNGVEQEMRALIEVIRCQSIANHFELGGQIKGAWI